MSNEGNGELERTGKFPRFREAPPNEDKHAVGCCPPVFEFQLTIYAAAPVAMRRPASFFSSICTEAMRPPRRTTLPLA